jgi:hypothetical protein
MHAFGPGLTCDRTVAGLHQRRIERTGPGHIVGMRDHRISNDLQGTGVAIVDAIERCKSSECQRRVAQRRGIDRNAAAVDSKWPGRRIVVAHPGAKFQNALLRRIVELHIRRRIRTDGFAQRKNAGVLSGTVVLQNAWGLPTALQSRSRAFVVRHVNAAL